MHAQAFWLLLICVSLTAASRAQVAFQPMAITGQPAPGLPANITFSEIGHISLADDGRVAFSGNITGPGVTSTNRQGIWAGLSNDLQIVGRTGDPVPGANPGTTFQAFGAPYMGNDHNVDFLALLRTTSLIRGLLKPNIPFYSNLDRPAQGIQWIPVVGLNPEDRSFVTYWNNYGAIAIAARVDLSGPSIGLTNDQAIVVGSATNVVIVARKGSPAPGTSGTFTFFSLDSRSLALTPDGRVAFTASAEGLSGFSGLWFGKANSLEAVALPGRPAPASLLGDGYTFGTTGVIGFAAVNGGGELAFPCSLAGPGLNNTNSSFVVAGPPAGLKVVAQSGQPAPGIPDAFFQSFSDVLMGPDGTVAFSASYSSTGSDYGVWITTGNGPPILLFRNGAHAPGTPDGVVFAPTFPFLPPYEQLYMNAQNQMVFRASLSGPGVSETNRFGIWLAEPDGAVRLMARAGDSFDVGGGVLRQPQNVTFGLEAETLAGPQDGRRSPFNDNGEIAIWATWQAPPGPPDFGAFRQGLFLAQTGLFLSAELVANEIQISFPTLSGKQYRVEFTPSLVPSDWQTLGAPITGTGDEVVVTDGNVTANEARYYRVMQTD